MQLHKLVILYSNNYIVIHHWFWSFAIFIEIDLLVSKIMQYVNNSIKKGTSSPPQYLPSSMKSILKSTLLLNSTLLSVANASNYVKVRG